MALVMRLYTLHMRGACELPGHLLLRQFFKAEVRNELNKCSTRLFDLIFAEVLVLDLKHVLVLAFGGSQ